MPVLLHRRVDRGVQIAAHRVAQSAPMRARAARVAERERGASAASASARTAKKSSQYECTGCEA